MKVKRCCGAVPLNLGIKLLAALDIIMWLQAAHAGDTLRFTFLMLTCSAFMMTYRKDSRSRRRNYFLTYALYRIVLSAIFMERMVNRQNYSIALGQVFLAVKNVCIREGKDRTC